MIRQDYGLDTLSVNGRLNEIKVDGFRRFIYSMGFSTLNSSGIGIRFRDFFNFDLLIKLVRLPIRLLQKNS